MDKLAASIKWVALALAVLAGPAVLILAGPFAAGIARDLINTAGALPILVTASCAVALVASLSVRSRTR